VFDFKCNVQCDLLCVCVCACACMRSSLTEPTTLGRLYVLIHCKIISETHLTILNGYLFYVAFVTECPLQLDLFLLLLFPNVFYEFCTVLPLWYHITESLKVRKPYQKCICMTHGKNCCYSSPHFLSCIVVKKFSLVLMLQFFFSFISFACTC
jgi:hypothetical protein